MKKVFALLFILFSITLYANAQKKCVLEGKLLGGDGTLTVYPYQEIKTVEEAEKLTIKVPVVNGRFKVTLDDARVLRNFIFTSGEKQKGFAVFTGPYQISVEEEGGTFKVKGSALHDEYLMLVKELKQNTNDTLTIQGTKSDKDKALKVMYQNRLLELIAKYPTSIPLSSLAYQSFLTSDHDILKDIIARFDSSIYSTVYLERFIERNERSKRVAIGATIPDFNLTDIDGKSYSLSSFRGNYVLVDFWASWCGPCRKEIPNLKKVYEAFKGKNLKMISVSVDVNEKPWILALNREKMEWLQLHDKDLSVTRAYNITGVPYSFLISPEGTIIAKNLHEEHLWEVLNRNIK